MTVYLALTVSSLNICLGVCIWVFHYMGTPVVFFYWLKMLIITGDIIGSLYLEQYMVSEKREKSTLQEKING